jgi:peptide/nickel transport system ATP-binding protein
MERAHWDQVPPILDVTDLSVVYRNGRSALRGVNLTLAPRRWLALVGEPGCGKSTLAWTIAGLLSREATALGSVEILGQDVLNCGGRARRRLRGELVGFLPFDPHFPRAGVLDRAYVVAAAVAAPLVVADELTAGMGEAAADSMLTALRRAGSAVVLTTRDIGLAGKHADFVAVMQAGRIVEYGPIETLLYEPRHAYTQALLSAAAPQTTSG